MFARCSWVKTITVWSGRGHGRYICNSVVGKYKEKKVHFRCIKQEKQKAYQTFVKYIIAFNYHFLDIFRRLRVILSIIVRHFDSKFTS